MLTIFVRTHRRMYAIFNNTSSFFVDGARCRSSFVLSLPVEWWKLFQSSFLRHKVMWVRADEQNARPRVERVWALFGLSGWISRKVKYVLFYFFHLLLTQKFKLANLKHKVTTVRVFRTLVDCYKFFGFEFS